MTTCEEDEDGVEDEGKHTHAECVEAEADGTAEAWPDEGSRSAIGCNAVQKALPKRSDGIRMWAMSTLPNQPLALLDRQDDIRNART